MVTLRCALPCALCWQVIGGIGAMDSIVTVDPDPQTDLKHVSGSAVLVLTVVALAAEAALRLVLVSIQMPICPHTPFLHAAVQLLLAGCRGQECMARQHVQQALVTGSRNTWLLMSRD